MKYVWVKYKKGRTEDIVNQRTLDDLLAQDAIDHFYRPSEARWVILGTDRIRENGGQYTGSDRRNVESQQRVVL
jgi:hypothetical protein